MPTEDRPKPRCFLALPYSRSRQPLRAAVERGIEKANFKAVSLDTQPIRFTDIREALLGELARADCVVADLTESNPNVYYELGLAQAMGKGVLLLIEAGSIESVPFDLRGIQMVAYEVTPAGLSELSRKVGTSLREFRSSARG